MQEEEREKKHLVNDYLRPNHMLKYFGGFSALSMPELQKALHSVIGCDKRGKPDMYALVDQKLIALEHFEFDASAMTRKGMKGKKQEALLQQTIDSALPEEFTTDVLRYDLSFENWVKNFEKCFSEHYGKIGTYWDALEKKLGSELPQSRVMGFFVENQYSPFVYIDDGISELPYICTRQFLDYFRDKKDVDFILFGTYCAGVPQLFYLDHQYSMPYQEAVDLFATQDPPVLVSLNETTLYGGCAFLPSDLLPDSDIE